MNSHRVLGDSVHGRGNEGRLEGDTLRDWGIERNSRGRKACMVISYAIFSVTASKRCTDVTREDEEIIIGQSTVLARIYKSMDVKAIAFVILGLEHIESMSMIEDLYAASYTRRDWTVVNVAICDGRHVG